MSRRARGRVLMACAAAVLLYPVTAQAARPLDLGFLDAAYVGLDADLWLTRTADAGADVTRIDVGWAAPNSARKPQDFDGRNPADPAYDFARADAAIRAASARRLNVIASFTGAPLWAEGRDRPASAPPGSWRPDPQALQEYGAALAMRYSGRFPDPLQPGQALPRVKAFQVWNEPNLSKYLSPQWVGSRAEAPALYRRMLNAFYRGVKSVDAGALVVTAGTAPFGDEHLGGARIMPARFVRDMLCVREGRRARAAGCRDAAHFDVLAHHPYSVGSPRRRALNDDDVSIPDLGKLTRLLRAAERSGGALPRVRHALWVTEISYDSSPPDPRGVPLARHARYLQETLYELWRQGVGTIVWFGVGDQRPDPSYADTNQSGVYFRDGRPKPALRAFRFPLVARRTTAASVRVWGRAPVAGPVRIERRTPAGWRTIRTLRAGGHTVFVTQIPYKGEVTLRARVGDETSLGWHLG